jgi:hypothetical protein
MKKHRLARADDGPVGARVSESAFVDMSRFPFKLRFPETKIDYWASRYSFPSEHRLEKEIAPAARARGYLTRPEFVEMCRWKTPRTQPLVRANSAEVVEAITRAALESQIDQVKIGVLRALRGVSWPTASVILHFCDQKPYPILDFRALWSLGYRKPPTYTLDFWLEYTEFVRQLAKRTGRPMRDVDKALWQYSSERQ